MQRRHISALQNSVLPSQCTYEFTVALRRLKMKLLLVDDDESLCELLSEYLTLEGFDVTTLHDGEQALAFIQENPASFAAIILDVMLPGMNGFDILKSIPQSNHTPVLMLTARGEDTDTVLGLELGADDYISKPVSPRVLVARLRAIIRRGQSEIESQKEARQSAELNAATKANKLIDLQLDETTREVSISGKPISLTGAEFNLLALLTRHAGQVLSRETLAQEGLGSALQAYDRRIETHIAQIRRKLGPLENKGERIKTIRGVGYQYVGIKTN